MSNVRRSSAHRSFWAVVPRLMMAAEVSNLTYNQIGVPDAFHPISHHQNDRTKIDKLVAQMDHDLFSEREQASQQAAVLGEAAEPFLKESLQTTTSAEARHRILPTVFYERCEIPQNAEISASHAALLARSLQTAVEPEARGGT